MAAPSTALPARSSLQSGRPMMMAALVTLPPAEWPPAVRVVGQLEWFDGAVTAEAVLQQQHDEVQKQGRTDPALDVNAMHDVSPALNPADSLSANGAAVAAACGVLSLRHGAHRLLVDTSLLQGRHSLDDDANAAAAAASDSAGGRLRWELGAWYSIIGDVVWPLASSSTPPPADRRAFVRARVCRALDDEFDLSLYEQTLQLLQSFR